MPANPRLDLAIRLLIASTMMGLALWYLASLWDARMREQNLILIRPVVLAMIPFYLWVVGYEIGRYRRIVRIGGRDQARHGSNEHLAFMAVAVASVVGFYLFGAIPATIATLIAGLLVLGVRQAPILVLLPLAVTLALWLVFAQGFGIRIPLFTVPW
jgi:hypothetical protein